MRYPLVTSTWGEEEIHAVESVLRSGRYTMGAQVRAFEEAFESAFGVKHAIMVNSGSSANLLAVASLFYRSKGALQQGDEVIVPAVSWATTYAPLHQYRLRLKIVDIDPQTLNVDLHQVEQAVGRQTKAIMAVNLLGCPNDFARLQDICHRYGLLLIEDNCEAMGARFADRYTGTFGICGTFSMFYSHHISTMEGGVIATNDEEISHILRSLRAHGWTRDLPERNLLHPKTGNFFKDAYCFILPGYNLRPLDISGAAGGEQLKKLPDFLIQRRRNARLFEEIFGNHPDIDIQKPIGESSWFAFAIRLKNELRDSLDDLVKHLTASGIECRPVVAGNFTKAPVMRFYDATVHGSLTHAEELDRQGFYIGNHHYDLSKDIQWVAETIGEFRNRRRTSP